MDIISKAILVLLGGLVVYLLLCSMGKRGNDYSPHVSYALGAPGGGYWYFSWNEAGDTTQSITFQWAVTDKATGTAVASGSTQQTNAHLAPTNSQGGPVLEADTVYTLSVIATAGSAPASPAATLDFTTPPILSGSFSALNLNNDGSILVKVTYPNALVTQSPFIDVSNSTAMAIVVSGEYVTASGVDSTFSLQTELTGNDVIAVGTIPAFNHSPGDTVTVTVTATTPVCTFTCSKVQNNVPIPNPAPATPTALGWTYVF